MKYYIVVRRDGGPIRTGQSGHRSSKLYISKGEATKLHNRNPGSYIYMLEIAPRESQVMQ